MGQPLRPIAYMAAYQASCTTAYTSYAPLSPPLISLCLFYTEKDIERIARVPVACLFLLHTAIGIQ